MGLNSVNITGNLTREPELRHTGDGMSVLRFGIAVNENRKSQETGEWEQKANFVECVAFRNRAEGLAKILTKGMKVAINGKLSYSSWETDGGEKRSRLEVVVSEIDIMQSKGEGRAATESRGSGAYEEDIPF